MRMRIGGLQKVTLLDYPGKVACTVFLPGCNLRCPFCHNPALVLPDRATGGLSTEKLLAFLETRRGKLDGVCVTGGEPTLQPELAPFLRRVKELGYAVKLDTNGTRPEVLRALVGEGLVDYVAMDVKNSPARYALTAGIPAAELSGVFTSMDFLLSGTVDYEFRTTVVRELHEEQDFHQIGRWLRGEVIDLPTGLPERGAISCRISRTAEALWVPERIRRIRRKRWRRCVKSRVTREFRPSCAACERPAPPEQETGLTQYLDDFLKFGTKYSKNGLDKPRQVWYSIGAARASVNCRTQYVRRNKVTEERQYVYSSQTGRQGCQFQPEQDTQCNH